MGLVHLWKTGSPELFGIGSLLEDRVSGIVWDWFTFGRQGLPNSLGRQDDVGVLSKENRYRDISSYESLSLSGKANL